jgi:SAM-dependent methyltransferase
VDTDSEAIEWLGRNLPVTNAAPIPVLPPTELESDSFDVIVGQSVFSHLSVDAQDRWLAELARVLRPEGHVAVSFNGPASLAWHLAHPVVDVPDDVSDAYRREGIAVWTADGWEREFYAGYHTTFHQHAYIQQHWQRWFEVISIWPELGAPTQDVVIMRARESG